MSCGHCVRAITQAIQALDAQAQVQVSLSEASVTVESSLDEAAVAAAIQEAGYSVQPVGI
jgi:copper chaperone